MAPLKTIKFPKSLTFCGEKFWENIFSCFQKILAKFSLTLTKNDWFYIVLGNYQKKKKRKIPKWKILVGHARKTGFSFFMVLWLSFPKKLE